MNEKVLLAIIIVVVILAAIAQLDRPERSYTTPPPYSRSYQANQQPPKETVISPSPAPSSHVVDQDYIERELADIAEQVRELQDAIVASVYQDHVSVHQAQARQSDERKEYIELRFSSDLPQSINISRWRVTSARTGRSATFGYADKVPYGSYRESDQLLIEPGDKAYVISGRSPLRGVSFRTNVCIGYWETSRDFYPSLSRSCPRVIDDIEGDELYGRDSLSDRCVRFIEGVNRCALPENDEVEEKYGNQCVDALEEVIGYSNCVELHRNDADFNGNTWYVYLNKGSEMWRQEREIITVYDDVGKVVGVVSYQ